MHIISLDLREISEFYLFIYFQKKTIHCASMNYSGYRLSILLFTNYNIFIYKNDKKIFEHDQLIN